MKIQNVNPAFPPMNSDVMVPVYASRPKWVKPTDQIDTWLDTQGFYRKHIARDASCLFRCVSEQIFLTQVHHLAVRKHCIQFALNQPEIFKQLTNIPVKDYVDRLRNQREWGNTLDMEIISRLYEVDFAVYKEIKKPMEQATSNGNNSFIMLSLSYEHHYDSVYPKQHILNAGICQSILYEILYKDVFKLEEVDYAVSKMLHDKNARFQSELSTAFLNTGFQMRFEMRDNCKNVKDLLNCGITPFPYKVAKSLDPNIYRNVEYDTWNEHRKGLRSGLSSWNSRELQVGTKCLVNFEGETTKRHGYIQQMSPNKGPVEVFIQELGEKLTVPYENLELIPNVNSVGSSDNIDMMSIMKMNPFANLECNENKQSYPLMEENVENSSKIRETYQSNCAQPNSDLCNVQYMHPTSSTVPTTCYACISSQSYPPDNDVKPMQQSIPVDEYPKYNYTSQQMNEINSTAEQPVPVVQYSMPLYSVLSPNAELQSASYPSNVLPPKPAAPNPNESNAGPVRVFCNSNVDPYYRCGLPTIPYYIIPQNYVYPVGTEPPVDFSQNIDVPRIQYSPPAVTQQQNDVVYAMPLTSIPNSKADIPVYPPVMPYPNVPNAPTVKKPLPRNNHTSDTTNTADVPAYRPPKEMVYLKEPPPVNTNVNISPSSQISTNVCLPYYSNSYNSITPPVYYHSIDYNGACYPTYPKIPEYSENITHPTYQFTQIVPLAYPEDVYQQSGQFFCQPMPQPISHN